MLNSISATLQRGVPPEKIQLEGLEFAFNKKNRYTPQWRVAEVGLNTKPSGVLETKPKPLAFFKTHSQNGVEPSLLQVENLLSKQKRIIQNLKELTRLTTHIEDKCVVCGFEGRMDWQATMHDGTWAMLCENCAAKIRKQVEEGE